MNDSTIFYICIIVSVIGILSIIGIIYFGVIILRNQLFKGLDHPSFWEEIVHRFPPTNQVRLDELPRHVVGAYQEYLERRNEFWATYGQVIIAVLIIIVLSILLLTKAISAEAGLPILSGISGFAIAKSVSGSKSINLPSDRQQS
jgi:hypothetical protein